MLKNLTKLCLVQFCLLSSLSAYLPFPQDNEFTREILVTKEETEGVPFSDDRLVNPWGALFLRNARSAINFVVANNGSNLATFYRINGRPLDNDIILNEAPTGLIFDPSGDFSANGNDAVLLSCTENGQILRARLNSEKAEEIFKSCDDAVYKALAIAYPRNEPRIYACDFKNNKIDVFRKKRNGKLEIVDIIPGQEEEEGFAPFGITVLGQFLYVSYAVPDADGEDDVPGRGNGLIETIQINNLQRSILISGPELNSPWAMVTNTRRFGNVNPNRLLVGNFGDGLINVYNASSGNFIETIDVGIGPGLWALEFLPDSDFLYYTAGPDDEEGEIGRIFPSDCN